MSRYAEVETLKLRHFGRNSDQISDLLFGKERDFEIVYTNSGKAALHIALSFYRSQQRLDDGNAEIWVPQWIGSWVYNIAQKICFPAITRSSRTRGILVYHQYGYPHKIDPLIDLARENNWFLIEDCAHALQSFDQGRRLGLLGDVGIFSFSKFFPSIMGGALATRDRALAAHALQTLEKSSSLLSQLSFFSKWAANSGGTVASVPALNNLVEMTYSVYDLCPAIHPLSHRVVSGCLARGSLKEREENAKFFITELSRVDVLANTPSDGVIPYVLPILGSAASLAQIGQNLEHLGIRSSLYHFDVNRNMANPDFQNCLWIPVHPGITRIREKILEAIKQGIQGPVFLP